MKISALIATAALVVSSAAVASEVNFTNVGANLNMGSVAAGQYGSISYNNPGAPVHRTTGNLAARTELVFSYTFSGPLASFASSLTNASYSYIQGGDSYTGNAFDNKFTSPLSGLNSQGATGRINGSPSTPLLFVTANLTQGSNTGSLTVRNESFGIANFTNILTLLFSANPDISSLTYAASSLSSVPLPAALPMMGTLVAGMFGARRLRRKAA